MLLNQIDPGNFTLLEPIFVISVFHSFFPFAFLKSLPFIYDDIVYWCI